MHALGVSPAGDFFARSLLSDFFDFTGGVRARRRQTILIPSTLIGQRCQRQARRKNRKEGKSILTLKSIETETPVNCRCSGENRFLRALNSADVL